MSELEKVEVTIEDTEPRSCANCGVQKALVKIERTQGVQAVIESPYTHKCAMCDKSAGAVIARALGMGDHLKDNWIPIAEDGK